MPQWHPTMGPIRFLAPVRFLARKAKWSACRNFTLVLFSWSHQATGPVRQAWHGCSLTVWLNNSQDSTWTPCDAHAGSARESPMFFISYRTHMGPVQDLQGVPCVQTCKAINTIKICKNPARASYVAVRGPYGPLMVPAQAVHGLFKISKPVRARKLIMHALKL